MQLGINVSEYNNLTPYELRIIAESHRENKQHEKDLITYGAWLTAKLSKAKKIPELNALMTKAKNDSTPQKRHKNKMLDYEIEIHLNRFKQERRLLLIG